MHAFYTSLNYSVVIILHVQFTMNQVIRSFLGSTIPVNGASTYAPDRTQRRSEIVIGGKDPCIT